MALEMLRLGLTGRAASFFVGVMVPGYLLFAEVILVTSPCNSHCTFSKLLEEATSPFRGLGGLAPGLLVLLGVSFVSFALGLFARQTSWKVWSLKPHERRMPLRDVVAALERAYGRDAVQDVIGRHPVSVSLDADRGPLSAPAGEARSLPPGSGTRSEGDILDDDFDSPRGHVFAYAKDWLSSRAPRLSVDPDEIRIDLLFGAFVPTFLMPVILLKIGIERGSTPTIIVSVASFLVTFGLGYLQVHEARKLQKTEHARAMRSFLFAHWFGAEPNDVARERADNAPS